MIVEETNALTIFQTDLFGLNFVFCSGVLLGVAATLLPSPIVCPIIIALGTWILYTNYRGVWLQRAVYGTVFLQGLILPTLLDERSFSVALSFGYLFTFGYSIDQRLLTTFKQIIQVSLFLFTYVSILCYRSSLPGQAMALGRILYSMRGTVKEIDGSKANPVKTPFLLFTYIAAAFACAFEFAITLRMTNLAKE